MNVSALGSLLSPLTKAKKAKITRPVANQNGDKGMFQDSSKGRNVQMDEKMLKFIGWHDPNEVRPKIDIICKFFKAVNVKVHIKSAIIRHIRKRRAAIKISSCWKAYVRRRIAVQTLMLRYWDENEKKGMKQWAAKHSTSVVDAMKERGFDPDGYEKSEFVWNIFKNRFVPEPLKSKVIAVLYDRKRREFIARYRMWRDHDCNSYVQERNAARKGRRRSSVNPDIASAFEAVGEKEAKRLVVHREYLYTPTAFRVTEPVFKLLPFNFFIVDTKYRETIMRIVNEKRSEPVKEKEEPTFEFGTVMEVTAFSEETQLAMDKVKEFQDRCIEMGLTIPISVDNLQTPQKRGAAVVDSGFSVLRSERRGSKTTLEDLDARRWERRGSKTNIPEEEFKPQRIGARMERRGSKSPTPLVLEAPASKPLKPLPGTASPPVKFPASKTFGEGSDYLSPGFKQKKMHLDAFVLNDERSPTISLTSDPFENHPSESPMIPTRKNTNALRPLSSLSASPSSSHSPSAGNRTTVLARRSGGRNVLVS